MDKSPPPNSAEDIEGARLASKIAREAVDAGHAIIKPGVTTEDIDKVVHDYIIS
jgi:methionyl aminopeptidase